MLLTAPVEFFCRPEMIELTLCGFLFPPEFSINDRLKHWATVFRGFDKVEVKALEQILVQKQRFCIFLVFFFQIFVVGLFNFYCQNLIGFARVFRSFPLGLQVTARNAEVFVSQTDRSGLEMFNCVNTGYMVRNTSQNQYFFKKQEDAPELQKRISGCFRTMSRSFSEPTKADEGFQILNQLKDVNIWKILTSILDPCTSFHQAWSLRVLAFIFITTFKVLYSCVTVIRFDSVCIAIIEFEGYGITSVGIIFLC